MNRGYGCWAYYCPECKWTSIRKTEPQLVTEMPCAACGHKPKNGVWVADESQMQASLDCWYFTSRVAETVVTVSEKQGERVRAAAEAHGLMVYYVSPKRLIVLEIEAPFVVKFGENGSAGGRAFNRLKLVAGPCDYDSAMKFLKDKTPALPAYLLK